MGIFAKLGESWGSKTDVWWPAVAAAIGGVLALAGPYFGQLSDKPAVQGVGLLVGVIGVIAAAVSPVYETFRHKNAMRDAKVAADVALREANHARLDAEKDANRREVEAEIYAREQFLLLIDWSLIPLVRKLADVLSHRRAPRRMELSAAELKTQILNVAKEIVGVDPTHVRANYFMLDWLESGDPILRSAGSTAHPPRDSFLGSSVEGQAVFDMLAQDGYAFCIDVDTDPPPGWDSDKKRPYSTFISVTAQCNSEPEGMLTVDARDAGDLDKGDVAVLKLLGVILAISESQRKSVSGAR